MLFLVEKKARLHKMNLHNNVDTMTTINFLNFNLFLVLVFHCAICNLIVYLYCIHDSGMHVTKYT